MEKWYGYAESVFFSKRHKVAYTFSVIYDFVVCQHNNLRKTSSSGSILHVNDIVNIAGCLCFSPNSFTYALA